MKDSVDFLQDNFSDLDSKSLQWLNWRLLSTET